MILNHTEPDDFVCATGVTNSVGDMCDYVFNKLDLNYKDYVTVDERFMRAEELKYLKGDATKLRMAFGWAPEYTFESLMDEMIEHWLDIYK
jgi:GDPmannose 4,6-dehydratase